VSSCNWRQNGSKGPFLDVYDDDDDDNLTTADIITNQVNNDTLDDNSLIMTILRLYCPRLFLKIFRLYSKPSTTHGNSKYNRLTERKASCG